MSIAELNVMYYQQKKNFLESKRVEPRLTMIHRFLNENCKLEFESIPDYNTLRGFIKNLFDGEKEH
jgi:hypothetical protein